MILSQTVSLCYTQWLTNSKNLNTGFYSEISFLMMTNKVKPFDYYNNEIPIFIMIMMLLLLLLPSFLDMKKVCY